MKTEVFYMIKGFSDKWDIFQSDRKVVSEYSLGLIAQEIAEWDFHQDPADNYNVEIAVKLKRDDKPRWFSVEAQPSVEFYSNEIIND